MFCSKCGQELTSEAMFCSGCGAARNEPPSAGPVDASPVEKGDPGAAVVIKPVFVPQLCLATTLPLTLFMTVWAGGFFGGFSMFAVQATGLPIPGWVPFVFFGALALFGLPFLIYNAQRRTYARTEYRFHHDRLDYFEGFFSVEEKTIPLSNVTEVSLRKGPLQKKHGLGTVVLSTPATSSNARAGIRVRDVRDADEVYRNVKALVERARLGPGPALRRAA